MKETVSMQGWITVDNADQMRRRLANALRTHPALVAVDLSDVPYMDTSGLATLMEAMRTARQYGTRLVLTGIQQQPRYLLKVTDLDHIIEIDEGATCELPRGHRQGCSPAACVWSADAEESSNVERRDVNSVVAEMSHAVQGSIGQLVGNLEERISGPETSAR